MRSQIKGQVGIDEFQFDQQGPPVGSCYQVDPGVAGHEAE
jgi:hypothetical protein